MNEHSTQKYRLELIHENHFDQLKQYAFEEDLWQFSTIKVSNEADFKKYFNQALRMTKQTSQRAYVVYDLLQKKYVGMTRLYAFDSKNKSTKLGFTWYAKAAQGSGINAHCKFLILQQAFENLGIERVELNADSRNVRSLAAMKKIGCMQEGILRQHVYLPDGYKRDTVIFSVLKSDWEDHVRKRLVDMI